MTLHEFIPPPAETYLEQIHQQLYPERWMKGSEIEAAMEDGRLNEEGIREWRGADDLEQIGLILHAAENAGRIKPWN